MKNIHDAIQEVLESLPEQALSALIEKQACRAGRETFEAPVRPADAPDQGGKR